MGLADKDGRVISPVWMGVPCPKCNAKPGMACWKLNYYKATNKKHPHPDRVNYKSPRGPSMRSREEIESELEEVWFPDSSVREVVHIVTELLLDIREAVTKRRDTWE